MNTTTLHYIYDPLCGWCYGAAPLVKAAREVLRVRPHGGGMMTGARRQAVTPQLREFVKPHDARIAQLSGQRFGEGYLDGLLRDTNAVFDSEPPTAAMLAAEAIAGRGLDMLAQLQVAHYVEGRHIADRVVLIEVAATLGLDPATFAEALDRQSGDAVQAHFHETRAFMAQVGAQGFPSFVLETGGVLKNVNVASYLGRPQDFQSWLRSQTNSSAATPVSDAFGCDANGCAI
ncbi:MAG: protein-disulfide isomerase [Curvibacter sp. PD_MW3]|nr:MAG: protein-disulfide isomerase [Curvibacter sp. PD_MW3]